MLEDSIFDIQTGLNFAEDDLVSHKGLFLVEFGSRLAVVDVLFGSAWIIDQKAFRESVRKTSKIYFELVHNFFRPFHDEFGIRIRFIRK